MQQGRRNFGSDGGELENSEAMRRSLTVAEVGVIISLLISTATGIFTMGVLYGDIQRAKADITEIKPKVDGVVGKVERIDANVSLILEMNRSESSENRGHR